jgi:hypothetical protein
VSEKTISRSNSKILIDYSENREAIEKKLIGKANIPFLNLVHPSRGRAVRGIDSSHVQFLKEEFVKQPNAIVTPLGVNIAGNFHGSMENFKILIAKYNVTGVNLENPLNWTTITGELFSGNHTIAAIKLLQADTQVSAEVKKLYKFRECIVYQGLTDHEMIVVHYSFNYF